MENFLVNAIYFEAPETPITLNNLFNVAVMLAKTFPIISSLIGLVFSFAIVQFFRLKIIKVSK